jgi:hypothetical protein
MKEQNGTTKAAATAPKDEVETRSQETEQSMDEQLAEVVERSYARKLSEGPANLSEEERRRIQDKLDNSKA